MKRVKVKRAFFLNGKVQEKGKELLLSDEIADEQLRMDKVVETTEKG